MKDWLAGTWEPNWGSFRYFNLYRLIVAVTLLASFFLPVGWNFGGRASELLSLEWMVFAYTLLVGLGGGVSWRWPRQFSLQLTIQVCIDVVVVSLIMYMLGGVGSGIGVLLLVALAAASLVGQGRMVLFYAAFSALSVLLLQAWGIKAEIFERSSMLQAGLLSAGFFATAILARMLGRRAMEQEDLARKRGIALENQNRIARRILERMQDGVLVVDPSGKALSHNPGAEEMLDMPVADGTRLEAHAPMLGDAYRRWRQGEAVGTIEFESSHGAQLRARFEATDSSSGEALIFIEDVGRIRNQALQLKLASLGRLTASIAHEIRNPLAAISHASDLLHEERWGEMHDRLLRILRDNIFRLDRIVQDILQLGRRDRGQPEIICLEGFLRSFVEEFCSVEHVEGRVIELKTVPGEWRFDRSQLLQVLWNLVSNGLRHASRKPGSLCLQMVRNSETGIELHVIDDGPGVPRDHREQVFEPFFTTCHQGTGLGLFIARELCEANGAVLELIPDVGGHFMIAGAGKCQQLVANDD